VRGIFFKSSIWALPVLILLPAVSLLVFYFAIDGYMSNAGAIFADSEWFRRELGGNNRGIISMSIITGVAVLINLLFLMIIPVVKAGLNSNPKKGQFYLGFFINLIMAFLVWIPLRVWFQIDILVIGMLIVLCLLSFVAPFLFSAYFAVSSGYRRAFWFYLRRFKSNP